MRIGGHPTAKRRKKSKRRKLPAKGRTLDLTHPKWSKDFKGPNGRILCKVCLTELSGRWRVYCSKVCVERFTIALGGWGFRRLIYRRDKGVCAICNETEKTRKGSLKLLRLWIMKYHPVKRNPLGSIKTTLGIKKRRNYWDVDHITPIVFGGTNLPENLRTLCLWCHKDETKKLRKEISERKKRIKNEKN